MKKVFFLIIAALLPLCVSAQQKGDMYISGSLALNGGNASASATIDGTRTTVKNPSAFNFQIVPEFGIFVVDRLQVNVGLGYSLTRLEPNKHSTDSENFYDFTNLFVISPGVSYYVPVCDKLYYTPGLSLGVGFGNDKTQLSSSVVEKNPVTTFGISLSFLEFEFRPCEHLGISLSAGDLNYTYLHTSYKEVDEDKSVKYSSNTNSVSLGLNLGATVGFKYYF